MATPSASSIFNFVKKYPITLCGFSLLFMPSVHRLLLYFTPLLLSTAIFIIAMLTWGPSTESSDQRGKKRAKRPEWALNGSFKIYGEDDEEEEEEEGEEEEEEEEKADSSIEGKASKKLGGQMQEPDPDSDGESKPVETASIGAIFPGQAEPDPDLGGEDIGTAASGAIRDQVDSAAPDLKGDCVGTAAGLHGDQHLQAAPSAETHQLHGAPDHNRHHHPHDHAAVPAPINHDEQAAEPDPDLQGSDGAAAQAKLGEAEVRVENDDVRAAIAELRQKLGLVQRAPLISDVDACDHRHAQQIAKGLQTLQAAA